MSSEKKSEIPKKSSINPEEHAGFLSIFFYGFVYPVVHKGWKEKMTEDDLWPIWERDASATLQKGFNQAWEAQQSRPSPSLFRAVSYIVGWRFFISTILEIITRGSQFVGPLLVGQMILFLEGEEPLWKGFAYAVGMFLASLVGGFSQAHHMRNILRIFLNVRSALSHHVFKKSFRLANHARSGSSVGQIINLMSFDCERVGMGFIVMNQALLAPIQVIIAFVLIWNILGPATLAGVGVMFIGLPLGAFIFMRVMKFERKRLTNSDKRVRLINEVLQAMRIVKMYSWEDAFYDQIQGIRDKECVILRKINWLRSGVIMLFLVVPLMVSLFSLGVYALSGGVINAYVVFSSLALFNVLRFPMLQIPGAIMNLTMAKVAMQRLVFLFTADEVDFLKEEMEDDEVEMKDIQVTTDDEPPIWITNGSFGWLVDAEQEEPLQQKGKISESADFRARQRIYREVLHDINFVGERRALTAIVGPVGSGKSTLLSALLHECRIQEGEVHVQGTVSYSAQQAWIQNATVRENILFGLPYDEERYQSVVKACCLEDDFKIWGGDFIEIGERGINMSGGQKQRVSLARAAYRKSDIYILDDPFSAVDTHVGKVMMDQCIKGILKDCTVIIVTNALHYLRDMDHIYVLGQEKEGGPSQIMEKGSYQQLMEDRGAFSKLILEHVGHHKESDEEGEETSKIKKTQDVGDGKIIEEELLYTGSVNRRVYWEYWMAAGGVGMFLVFALSVLLNQAALTANDVWLTLWSDGHLNYSMGVYLTVYALAGLLAALLSLGKGLLFANMSSHASATLHKRLLKAVMLAPVSFFDNTPIGRILNRFSKDTDQMDTLLPQFLENYIGLSFIVLASLVVVSWVMPIFLIPLFFLGVLAYFVQRYVRRSALQLQRVQSNTRSPIFAHFGEVLTGICTLRTFRLYRSMTALNASHIDKNATALWESRMTQRWLSLALQSITSLIIGCSAMGVVLYRDRISSSFAALALTYTLTMSNYFGFLAFLATEVENRMNNVERIVEYSKNVRPEAPLNPGPCLDEKGEATKEIKVAAPENWPQHGKIEARNMSLRYGDALPLVLKQINFVIQGGERIGVCGRTGAGKSSLTVGLFRIVELCDGSIWIDDVDTHTLALKHLRQHMSIIPQDPVLFAGTLRINLDPFDEQEDAKLWEVLELIQMAERVKSQPDGLLMMVEEGGSNYSVGERQLLCLGRALMRHPKILVCDEATSSVDAQTDGVIQQIIRQEFKDCTIITIAHRLHTIMDSDRIMVMEDGHIAEMDTPSNLLRMKDGVFASLVQDMGGVVKRQE